MPVPQNASGAVFMRHQDVVVHFGENGSAEYSSYRVKLLQSSALQIGNISIAWMPTAGNPVVHKIEIHRDGEVIDVLKNASFEVLRREDQLEAARLDGILTAIMRVPDLRVGDELDIAYTTYASDPTLGKNESGTLFLGQAPAPGRYHLGLNWDEGHKPSVKMTDDMTAAMQKGDRAVDFRFDNPSPISAPKDAPGRYQWQRIVQYSDFADWPALSRHFAPVFATAATLAADSPLKREATRIAAAYKSPLDRASAALKLVQQDVRYIYVGLDGGNLRPASADETWQRRYGDCKGKTALLIALLSELGISAEPVLVNSSGSDDGLDQRLPIVQLFDHVLVRAHIDGMNYWLDGTLPPVVSPSLEPVYEFKYVLPLSAQSKGLEASTWRAPAVPDEIHLFEIDARAGFDKSARIAVTTILRGFKGLEQQVQFSPVSSAQLLQFFQQKGLGNTWQAIDDVKWRYDEKVRASILTISGPGIVDWEDGGDGEKSLALPGGGFNPPERRVRPSSQDAAAPYYTKPEYACHVTTVRLPSSTQAKHWSTKPSYHTHIFGRTYHRAWELRDGAIRMVRGSRVDHPEIDAATAARDNARISAFDNSMGWITYQPSGQKALVGRGETVPATYEIDWTADDVPCLAATK